MYLETRASSFATIFCRSVFPFLAVVIVRLFDSEALKTALNVSLFHFELEIVRHKSFRAQEAQQVLTFLLSYGRIWD